MAARAAGRAVAARVAAGQPPQGIPAQLPCLRLPTVAAVAVTVLLYLLTIAYTYALPFTSL